MLSQYIHIDPLNDRTLQDQIKSSIAQAIFEGFIPEDKALVSSRRLAKELQVSRNTILRVYEQLTEDGILVSLERKGYFINPALELPALKPIQSEQQPETEQLDWSNYLITENTVSKRVAQDLDRYPYLFVSGVVDEDLFPVSEWRKCSIQSLNKSNHRTWTSVNAGSEALIEQVRTRVLPKRGIFVDKDQIAVTLGCQNSLYYLSKLLVSSQTTVGIENPGYPEALHQFQARRANICPLPVDHKGIAVDQQMAQCQLVYTTPSNQFPTTVRLSPDRRKKLMDMAQEHDFLIIEDDFEHDINFIEDACPALKSEYPSDRIIYISSFTSTLAPGLRIGYIVAPEPLITQIKALQFRTHSCPPKNNCQTLALFLSLGHYDSLAQKMLKRYREKWLTMEKALNYYFPQSGVIPSLAGTAFWINYKQGFDAEQFEELAEQQGILINNGGRYYFSDKKTNSFRLSFQSIRTERIREGVALLSQIAKQIMPIEQLSQCAASPLSSKAIRQLLTNKVLLTKDCFNIPYRISFQADGKMTGVSDRPNDIDEGYWWVEKDKFFYQWRNWQFADIRKITIVLENNEIKRFDEDGYFIGEAQLIGNSSSVC
ncbi:HTH-type transcriptional regulatory protein GabR [Vibrio aerogenes CECT 7868]|uniref:HTH-type transcriptional regulatory protein GabR n=1 Tax=Vibrio aerogenes CECT 7868 TaxID=1216006 RepID=A0A1M5UNY8_9VIBR|nr:PLP-dependent aminotransferase family protein [Vibrio aerogenes]SHH64697.1 HTH-type transcriptional regulatory protein GabR [Vibrio aerogenes CECT 7868]